MGGLMSLRLWNERIADVYIALVLVLFLAAPFFSLLALCDITRRVYLENNAFFPWQLCLCICLSLLLL